MSTRSTAVLSASPSVGNSNQAGLYEIEDQDWFSDFDYSDIDDEPRFVLPGRIQTGVR